jgi:hypothetical protein
MTSTLGRGSIGPVNFDSPSVSAAALDALGLNTGADALDGIPELTLSSEEDRAMRFDWVISTLSVRTWLEGFMAGDWNC